MPDELKDALEKATAIYSVNAPLRAAICSIPFIGPAIDAFVATTASKLMENRIRKLIDNLKSEMQKLQADKLDKAYLESEEFVDLIVRAFEYTTRTRDDDKIELYAKILRGAVNMDNRNEYAEEYLEVIKELTPVELKIARTIYEQQNDQPNEGENELQWATRKGWDDLHVTCGISKVDLRFLLLRIERTGLIKELTGGYYDYSGEVYVTTDMFKRIMKS